MMANSRQLTRELESSESVLWIKYLKATDGANPVSILHKSIAGRYRPVRVADGPITARCRFIKNASWELAETSLAHNRPTCNKNDVWYKL